jgi:hypothetical protein
VAKPIVLWSVPRSLSTAFERVFVERDDFDTLHEPFSQTYYYGADRMTDRYTSVAKPGCTCPEILAEVLRPRERPLFIKDMSTHIARVVGPEFLSNFVNTFIIRDPRYALTSLYRMMPDFNLEEAGFELIHRAFGYAAEAGETPVVIDARTFSEDPAGTMAAYCSGVGIPFRPEAMTWTPREVPEWSSWSWEGWHQDAQWSSGIRVRDQDEIAMPDEVQDAYEACRPYYETLARYALVPATS